jgi:hypothetical protein
VKFVIGEVAYFNSVGFSTSDWRCSTDGTKAIVHEKFVEVLIPSVGDNINLTVYSYPSAELDAILESAEWTDIV